MKKTVHKMSSHQILDAIISNSEEGENHFLKIFTDHFGGKIRFDDNSDSYLWTEETPDERQYDVEIEIRGGVANLVKKAGGITIQIRDYDVEGSKAYGDKFEESNYDENEEIGL